MAHIKQSVFYFLRHIKSHSSREVLIIMGALNTCDPGDIFETIKECKKLKLRISIIGLAAEVHICKKLCAETEGVYSGISAIKLI